MWDQGFATKERKLGRKLHLEFVIGRVGWVGGRCIYIYIYTHIYVSWHRPFRNPKGRGLASKGKLDGCLSPGKAIQVVGRTVQQNKCRLSGLLSALLSALRSALPSALLSALLGALLSALLSALLECQAGFALCPVFSPSRTSVS
jgi:hypothetical protein